MSWNIHAICEVRYTNWWKIVLLDNFTCFLTKSVKLSRKKVHVHSIKQREISTKCGMMNWTQTSTPSFIASSSDRSQFSTYNIEKTERNHFLRQTLKVMVVRWLTQHKRNKMWWSKWSIYVWLLGFNQKVIGLNEGECVDIEEHLERTADFVLGVFISLELFVWDWEALGDGDATSCQNVRQSINQQ